MEKYVVESKVKAQLGLDVATLKTTVNGLEEYVVESKVKAQFGLDVAALYRSQWTGGGRCRVESQGPVGLDVTTLGQ
jgi:hypothetical protein